MADFYGTVAGFKSYFTARGNTLAAAEDDPDIQAALLVASEWLDAAFLDSFDGLKVGGRAQIREWPRQGVTDIYGYSIPDDTIPREVESATYEATWRQLQTPGVFFKDYTPAKYKSVSISGAVSVEYATGSAYDFQTQQPMIAAILRPLFSCYSESSALSGAVSR